ncbi:gtpase-activating protein gyp7 [Quercus suber]|uniref:Gtpase-activating protein gyp7 n=1 Tax=Quercus suber TaxID=58331 RepID=A0AAW0KLX0_QUESU
MVVLPILTKTTTWWKKKKKQQNTTSFGGCGEGLTVISRCFFLLMLFLSTGGDGNKSILLVEANSHGGGGGGGVGGGFGGWASSASSNVGIAIIVTAMAGIALAATVVYSRRGSLKSPWSRKRRKHALLPKQWKRFFTPDGRLSDGGANYDMNSTQEERDLVKEQKRREYGSLRKQCKQILKRSEKSLKFKETSGISSNEGSGDFSQVLDSSCLEDMASASRSPSIFGRTLTEDPDPPIWDQALQSPSLLEEDGDKSGLTCEDASAGDTESSDSDSSEEPEDMQPLLATKGSEENYLDEPAKQNSSSTDLENKSPSNTENKPKPFNAEDFAKWQRIIRLDALRTNDEWIAYSPTQSAVSEIKAHQLADSVGLKEYDHLEPCRVFHAARMVAILEAYALHDPEIGYCQGMSDLLDPIITVFEEDHQAFWCFVGFMKKARHNFRLDEVGIQRQLKIVSKIIQRKDIHLYRHLEKLQAEDCFFVYRMVIVLFRRELSFEQTLCLWEVIWADQAAIRAGTAKSTWGRIRLRAPPNEDLLLYAISACVLQKRKLIIEKYSSMDEIMRECNSMAGRLDVWKLLDDAHDLVVTLHDKI